ncbi:MAG TPA: hypothetical protein VK563_05885 [Puia sp.]|nr:hypothetical protein [Puia sp.]
MKYDSFAVLTPLLPELALSANNNPSRPKTEVIRLRLSAPPDDKKIMELNELASSYPFCVLYKAKKHDTL